MKNATDVPGPRHWRGSPAARPCCVARPRDHAALRRACAEAEATARAKSALLAEMSHEIRTPLNALVGLLELTLQTPLDAAQREYVTLMQQTGQSLLGLLNDLLDFSRIEAGRLDMEHTPFALRATLRQVVDLLALNARQKGLRLSCEIAADVPDALQGDPLRLRQVLTNLLGNAIKFTTAGEVALRVERLAGTGADVSCRFSVRDTGIGIAPEVQAGLFAAWAQGGPGTARQYGGSGLGLAIASRLVALMHGRIWLESAPGRGSTFHFTACFGEAAPHPRPVQSQPQPAAQAPLCILLVEDSPINSRLAQLALEQAGHRVLPAASGSEAAACLATGPDSMHPDLVLLDLRLPDSGGLELARRLRRLRAEQDGGELPIIALTASADLAEQACCQAAGFAGYLQKPLAVPQLHALWQGLAGPRLPLLAGDALLEQVQRDPALLDEIAGLFRRDAGSLLKRLATAIAAADEEAFAHHLHTLRGMLHSLGGLAAQAAADGLADCAGNWPAASLALDRLTAAIDQLDAALAALRRELGARHALRALLGQTWATLRLWLAHAWQHRPHLPYKVGRRFEQALLRGTIG